MFNGVKDTKIKKMCDLWSLCECSCKQIKRINVKIWIVPSIFDSESEAESVKNRSSEDIEKGESGKSSEWREFCGWSFERICLREEGRWISGVGGSACSVLF